jgi:hypothetical protein
LRRVFDLVEPYKDGDYCLGAEHDALTIGLDHKPDDAATAALLGITGVALSWRPDESGSDEEWDGETLIVTCFT